MVFAELNKRKTTLNVDSHLHKHHCFKMATVVDDCPSPPVSWVHTHLSRLPLFIKFFLTNVFFLRCSRHPIRTQASLVHPGATLPFNSCICLVKFCMTLNFGQFNLCLLTAKGTPHSLVHWDLSQNTLGAPRQAAPKYTSMAYSLPCNVTWETAFGEKWYLKKKNSDYFLSPKARNKSPIWTYPPYTRTESILTNS